MLEEGKKWRRNDLQFPSVGRVWQCWTMVLLMGPPVSWCNWLSLQQWQLKRSPEMMRKSPDHQIYYCAENFKAKSFKAYCFCQRLQYNFLKFWILLIDSFNWQLNCRWASLAGLYLPSCVIMAPLGDLTPPCGRCALAGVSSATEPQLQWGTAPNPSLCWKTKHSRSCVFKNKILDRMSVFRGKIFLFPLEKVKIFSRKSSWREFFEQPWAAVIRIQY